MNIKKLIVYFATLMPAIFYTNAITIAQGSTGEHTISGTVADSTTQKGIAGITLKVTSDKNVFIRAGFTKEGGSFSFSGLKPLRYSIEVLAAGYNTKMIAVDLTDSNKIKTDLGIIYIAKKISSLDEVIVTAGKPVIKQEIDRIIYDLQADPDSKGNSVLEMMRKVPYLSLDAEDNLLLKGNASYKILIDGKPSSLVERNPKEVLRSMPASTIKKIEVITNPSSKYDAEGLAGIINIITNKNSGNGYNGSLNINEQWPVGGPGFGGSFAVKHDKFGISGYGGASVYNRPQTTNSINRVTNGNDPTNLQQDGTTKTDSRSGYFGAELSYEIDSLNLISGQLNLNASRYEGTAGQHSLLSGKNGIIQGYDLVNANEGNGKGIDGALNYQLGFKGNKSRLLTFSYRHYRYNNDQNSSLSISDPVNFQMPDYRQANNTIASENTFQVDHIQQVKGLGIEAGIKGIMRDNKSDFQYFSFNKNTGNFEMDTSQANQFDYNQNIFGAYNSYQYSFKNWDLRGGVRIEQTVISAKFISTASGVEQNYFNIIPSIAVKRKLKGNSNVNLGFTQRIKRPGINRLNPFVDRSNPNFESMGNPNLRPVLSNRIQLGYGTSKKITLNVSLDYTFVKNIDLRVSYFDPATNITRATFENTGKAAAIDNNFYVSYPISKSWNLSVNGTVTYMWLEGIVNKVLVKDEWLIYALSASSGYRFNKGWRVNASLNIISRNPTSLQGTTNALIRTTFGVNKDIIKDKLSFSASVSNPFTKYRNNIVEMWGPGFTERSYAQNYFRAYNIGLNYNFGKLKQAVKKSKRGIRNDDVSDGKGL